MRAVAPAPEGFDARFSALWRRYAYRVADGPALVDPLIRGHVLSWPRPLDLDAMNRACEPLLGLQDFAAFCKQREGATTVRTLLDLDWTRDADRAGRLLGPGRRVLPPHGPLVGRLPAGGGGWPAGAVVGGAILAAGARDPAVAVAPAHGLTLEEVGYPASAELAARADRARAKREVP